MTHGGFLHYFSEDWEDSSQYQGNTCFFLHLLFFSFSTPALKSKYSYVWTGTGWANTEYRTFEFSDEVHTDDLEGYKLLDGDNATLVETAESRLRRGKDEPALTRERQRILYKLGMQGWDDQGLQLSTAEREQAKVTEGKEVGGVRI